jgi:phosphatidate cytidylyltransferase
LFGECLMCIIIYRQLLVVAPSAFWISTLEEFGMEWILYSVVLVAINDTMAYFFGITMGRHPLLPSISPKKTWEGFLGAAITTTLVAMFWLPTQKDGLVISAFASLVGPFGGFLASLIKRAYSQKDFGSLFPGHGGLVDRLDCQVILAPFIYLYLTLSRNNEESVAELLTKMADSIIS